MSVGSYVVLSIELGVMRDFLEHVDREAGIDIKAVFEQWEAGEFADEDDFENALYRPVWRQEMAARAVYYELNALVERELQDSARSPYEARTQGRRSNGRAPRPVEQLKYGELVKLIEDGYGFRLVLLPGSEVVQRVRDMVNAFKHRDGNIVRPGVTPGPYHIPERYKAEVMEAFQAIDETSKYVRALWQATGRAPRPDYDIPDEAPWPV